MAREQYQFAFDTFDVASDLNAPDLALFNRAVKATGDAYAPYSKFHVGAAALLENGEIVTGGNQENASFPAGLCAEGVVMAAASARFPGVPIVSIAITSKPELTEKDHILSPCGICRQTLQEYRQRFGKPVRVIMGAENGKVIVLEDASMLLPFAFKF